MRRTAAIPENYTCAAGRPREVSGLIAPPLRICIASGTFHPDAGGPPTYLLALGRELVALGHHVRVVTYGDEPARRRYPYPVVRVPRQNPPLSRLLLFAREVWRAGRDVDLLFVNDYGLPAAVANLALRKPLVMKIVGDFAWEYSVRHGHIPRDEPLEEFQRRRYGPRVEAVRLLQATYARRADLLITPSEYVKRYVVGWGVSADRVRVVRNAVADPTPGLALDRAGARAALGLDADADVALVVARLTPWKGIDTLIRALRPLRDRRPTACLVVVGDGPDRPRLEALAAELSGADGRGGTACRVGAGSPRPSSVHFAGETSPDHVALYLRAADVLALCSGYEGLSHVLLEGTVAGVPIVASAIGGNLELIRDGENGLLVPFGDVDATAHALVRLLEDRSLADRLAAAARCEARERTVGRMVDQTLAVFAEAIAMQQRGLR